MRFRRRNSPATASDPTASDSRTSIRRRGFLLALGAGGAGAAALAARSLSGVVPQDDASGATDDSKGYQVTDHVKRYYRTAKI
jgi:ferric-dicitrate binding protein FerR (iron transport regulator)